jgi:hypothetical protein
MKPRSGLPKVSPSLIVASIALLVALGGTSLAAVSVILPANSVGTKQLKNNAVTSAKVKDGSLKAIDLAPGVLAASPGVGAAGPAGPAGAPGAAGPTGATGPSDAFSAYRDAISPPPLPANATTTIVTLALQPGKYVIVGKVNLEQGDHVPSHRRGRRGRGARDGARHEHRRGGVRDDRGARIHGGRKRKALDSDAGRKLRSPQLWKGDGDPRRVNIEHERLGLS